MEEIFLYLYRDKIGAVQESNIKKCHDYLETALIS